MEKIMPCFAFLFVLLSIVPIHKISSTLVPAFYIFGDSTVDAGNNNYLSGEPPKANFPHYGIDFPGSIPTGRFTNGFLAVDYIAQALGFVQSPPPSLSPINDKTQILRGLNFASAGSGILDTTGKDVISLDAQIENFAGVARRLKSMIGRQATADHLSKSLLHFSTGSNDLYALYARFKPANSTQNDYIVVTLIDKFRDQLKLLYKLGARRFSITGTSLIGDMPAFRVVSTEHEVFKDINMLSYSFKVATNAMLKSLSEELNDFHYSFGDAYEIYLQVSANPSSFGFVDLESACCGSGELNAEEMCAPNTTYCHNRDQYYNWDRVHPTQAVYNLIAEKFLFGSFPFATPINIYQLITESKNIINKASTAFI